MTIRASLPLIGSWEPVSPVSDRCVTATLPNGGETGGREGAERNVFWGLNLINSLISVHGGYTVHLRLNPGRQRLPGWPARV